MIMWTKLAVALGLLLVPLVATARPIAFVSVTVLPMDGRPRLERQTVVVDKGRITAIAPAGSSRVPRNALRIDGRGRTLMPGLSDMHAHVFGYPPATSPAEAAAQDRRARFELLAYLATGVTVLREANGSPTHLRYRAALTKGDIVGPALFVASPVLEGPQPTWPLAMVVAKPESAEHLVASFARDGYDFVKVYHTLPGPTYTAIMASAKGHRLKVIGHVPFDVVIEAALASGQYSIEHLRGYDFEGLSRGALDKQGGRSVERFSSWQRIPDDRLAALADATVKADAWNCPTLAVAEWLANPTKRLSVLDDPEFKLYPPDTAALVRSNDLDKLFPDPVKAAIAGSLPRSRAFVRLLHERGAKLLIGTDSGVPFLVRGFTPIDEIQAFVAAGIPTADVLRIATADAARSLGVYDRTGSVTIGKHTDLILVEGDPVADPSVLWRLVGVTSRGRWRTKIEMREELARLSAAIAADLPPSPS